MNAPEIMVAAFAWRGQGWQCGGERAVKDRSLVRTIEVGNSYVVL